MIREACGTLIRLKILLLETVFAKSKEETPKQATPPNTSSLCTHYKKSGHTQRRCHTRFLERYEFQLNRLLNDFNSLKNNILNTWKGNKSNPKPKT